MKTKTLKGLSPLDQSVNINDNLTAKINNKVEASVSVYEKRKKVISIIMILVFMGLALCFIILSFQSTRKNALLGDSCIEKSCETELKLECINGICDCSPDSFYAKGCKLKKKYLEKCSNFTFCDENTKLTCLDGACKCDNSKYWNGQVCELKRTYNEQCQNSDIECLTQASLYCDASSKKCLCNNNRYS